MSEPRRVEPLRLGAAAFGAGLFWVLFLLTAGGSWANAPVRATPSTSPPRHQTLPAAAAVTSADQCGQYANYAGAEPAGYAELCLGGRAQPQPPAAPAQRDPTDLAFALDIGFVSDNFVSHQLNDFPGQTVLGSNAQPIFGMDFDPTATSLYALDDDAQQLGTLNLANGAFSPIGPSLPLAGHTLTGLTIHPDSGAAYVSSTDGATAALYTLDLATGALTFIGSQTTTPLLIDIAMNAAGLLYGHDISTDSIYTIDPATAAATLVGPTGVNSNFAQGMDFDNEDGTLYAWTYQGGG
ncbi:MAG: DUF4394 domain-containing protein, partial [Candidatus Promineifilaceae bacterium]